jgi:hypothetical protein
MTAMGENVADYGGTGSGTGEGWGDYHDLYYSVPEAAKIIGIAEGRIRQLARAGTLEGDRPEGYWKLYRYSVHDYRDRKREQEGPSEVTESSQEAREWIERVSTSTREGAWALRRALRAY